MWSSVASNLHRIGPPGRRFLAFTMVNVIAVHCVANSSLLVLFARHIDMPPALVGLLMSFAPLSAMLVVFTSPLVERLGPRRLMMRTWVVRNLVFSLIFLMPLAIAWKGNHAAWAILIIAVLGFSLTRAVGMGGWMPWLHETLPENSRGLYFGFEMSILQTTGIALAVLMALILGHDPTVKRFLLIMAFGVTMGLISESMIKRIPGGNRAETPPRPINVIFGDYRQVFQDKRFMGYTWLVFWGVCAFVWVGSVSVMYMRDVLHYSSNHILFISGTAALGVSLTIRRWGLFADRHGSGKAMSLSLAGMSLVCAGWFLLLPGAAWTDYLVWPVVIFTGIFGASFWAATNCAILANITAENRIPYSNIWIIARAAANGLTPILAGLFVQHLDLGGYMACFCIGMILSTVGTVVILRVRDDDHVSASYRTLLSRPARPLQVLWQIGDVMFGISGAYEPRQVAEEEESKRTEKTAAPVYEMTGAGGK